MTTRKHIISLDKRAQGVLAAHEAVRVEQGTSVLPQHKLAVITTDVIINDWKDFPEYRPLYQAGPARRVKYRGISLRLQGHHGPQVALLEALFAITMFKLAAADAGREKHVVDHFRLNANRVAQTLSGKFDVHPRRIGQTIMLAERAWETERRLRRMPKRSLS